jgi:hypothetical protein
MAYGFQNTCDTDEFFYLDNVPGYVSVNEFYYIVTQEGDIFCGKYVNIPAVDYQIQTYNLVGMTAQTSETSCNNINPCPDFFIPPTQNVSTTQVNECACLTEYPLGASCVVPNVTPQNPNVTVNLKITGGTAPYSIYSANTETLITNVATNGGTSNISVFRPSGTYCFDIYDFYQTKISHCCTVNTASTILTATYSTTNTNQCYNSGSVAVTINGGTPPYTVYKNGASQGPTTNFLNLGPSSISFYVTDSSTPMQQTPTTTKIITTTTITYPPVICMTITICGQQFNLTFNLDNTTICPPSYICENPGVIGSSGLYLTGNTLTNQWGIAPVTIDTSSLNLPGNCNILTNNLSFTKVQNTPQPTGDYNIQGAFATGISTVTNGTCSTPPTFTYTKSDACGGSNNGQIVFVPQGGTSPYSVKINGVIYPTNQFIFSNLTTGNYSLSIIDSTGLQSSFQYVYIANSNPPALSNQISPSCFTIDQTEVTNGNTKTFTVTINFIQTFNSVPAGQTISFDRATALVKYVKQYRTGDNDLAISQNLNLKIYKNDIYVAKQNTLIAQNPSISIQLNITQTECGTAQTNRNTEVKDFGGDLLSPTNQPTLVSIQQGDTIRSEFTYSFAADMISTSAPCGVCCFRSFAVLISSYNLGGVTDDFPNDLCFFNNLGGVYVAMACQTNITYATDTVTFGLPTETTDPANYTVFANYYCPNQN